MKPTYPARKPGTKSRYHESEGEIWAVGLLPRGVEPPIRAREAYERPSRANFQPQSEPARVRLKFRDDEIDLILAFLHACPIPTGERTVRRAGGTRQDWIDGVLLEVLEPPADIAQAANLEEHVDRAIWRFEWSLRRFSCRSPSLGVER